MFIKRLLSVAVNKSRGYRKQIQILPHYNTKQSYSGGVEPKMAENIYTGMLLGTILKGLENFAPLKLAEEWDNVGLLVDPIEAMPIKTVLLTNDLTEGVVEEAVKMNVGLIVSYHPNIFQGLKSVSSR